MAETDYSPIVSKMTPEQRSTAIEKLTKLRGSGVMNPTQMQNSAKFLKAVNDANVDAFTSKRKGASGTGRTIAREATLGFAGGMGVPESTRRLDYNPVKIIADAPGNIVDSHIALAKRIPEDVTAGHYADAIRHTVEAAIPVIGPAMSQAGEELDAGVKAHDTAMISHAIGTTAGLGLSIALGKSKAGVDNVITDKGGTKMRTKAGSLVDKTLKVDTDTVKQQRAQGLDAGRGVAKTIVIAKSAEHLETKIVENQQKLHAEVTKDVADAQKRGVVHDVKAEVNAIIDKNKDSINPKVNTRIEQLRKNINDWAKANNVDLAAISPTKLHELIKKLQDVGFEGEGSKEAADTARKIQHQLRQIQGKDIPGIRHKLRTESELVEADKAIKQRIAQAHNGTWRQFFSMWQGAPAHVAAMGAVYGIGRAMGFPYLEVAPALIAMHGLYASIPSRTFRAWVLEHVADTFSPEKLKQFQSQVPAGGAPPAAPTPAAATPQAPPPVAPAATPQATPPGAPATAPAAAPKAAAPPVQAPAAGGPMPGAAPTPKNPAAGTPPPPIEIPPEAAKVMEQAKTEPKVTKAAEGEHGTGKLAKQAKDAERKRKARADAAVQKEKTGTEEFESQVAKTKDIVDTRMTVEQKMTAIDSVLGAMDKAGGDKAFLAEAYREATKSMKSTDEKFNLLQEMVDNYQKSVQEVQQEASK